MWQMNECWLWWWQSMTPTGCQSSPEPHISLSCAELQPSHDATSPCDFLTGRAPSDFGSGPLSSAHNKRPRRPLLYFSEYICIIYSGLSLIYAESAFHLLGWMFPRRLIKLVVLPQRSHSGIFALFSMTFLQTALRPPATWACDLKWSPGENKKPQTLETVLFLSTNRETDSDAAQILQGAKTAGNLEHLKPPPAAAHIL